MANYLNDCRWLEILLLLRVHVQPLSTELPHDLQMPSLSFDSSFESANLLRAVQVGTCIVECTCVCVVQTYCAYA